MLSDAVEELVAIPRDKRQGPETGQRVDLRYQRPVEHRIRVQWHATSTRPARIGLDSEIVVRTDVVNELCATTLVVVAASTCRGH
jgi:hypothetical protein